VDQTQTKKGRKKSPWDNPTYIRETLKSLTERAGKGDAEAMENLKRMLTDRPDLKGLVRELDDLGTKVVDAWVKTAAFDDKVAEGALREEVARMKAELLGPNPTVLDKILVDDVVASYLANKHATAMAAMKVSTPGLATHRDRRAESAQKRQLAAIKGMLQIRRLTDRGTDPPSDVSLFDPLSELTSGDRGAPEPS
jgi:hypothetical protein